MSRRFVLSLFAVFLVLLTISCSSTKGAVEVVKEEDAVEQVLPVSITEDGRIIVSDHVLTLLMVRELLMLTLPLLLRKVMPPE